MNRQATNSGACSWKHISVPLCLIFQKCFRYLAEAAGRSFPYPIVYWHESSEIIGQLKMKSADGKMYSTDVADQEQLFRLVQSIPSPKVEPIKIWIAQVASERIDEMIDPEISIDRAIDMYRRKGYSEEWINQRLQGKKERKKLTDEWKRVGVKEKQYAILTNAIYEVWSGMSAKEYKHYKGLKKENLRDNMTDTESALTTLAEVATREISQNEDPATIAHNVDIAHRGGKVAKVAREALEEQLGRSVISQENAKTLNPSETIRQIDDQSQED
ncbi:MAG: hypothetical protein LKK12_02480 [Bacteroidales bacterium]|nr:hypothetical protein [Bacteroidales bacterium]